MKKVEDIREVGATLRRGREYLGLSIEAMAERARLDPSVIAALETESYAALGAPVFARGHLRRYALTLNLDADAIQRAYEARESTQAPDLMRAPRAVLPPNPRRFLWPVVIIAGLAVLAGILWWALHSPAAPKL
jgi:cytoskeleton protein RodZ